MTCETCKANKVCDHYKYGFENCGNYIPTDDEAEMSIKYNALLTTVKKLSELSPLVFLND